MTDTDTTPRTPTFGEIRAAANELEATATLAAENASYYGTIVADLTAKVDTGGSVRDHCLIDVIKYAQAKRDENRNMVDGLREEAARLRAEFGRR